MLDLLKVEFYKIKKQGIFYFVMLSVIIISMVTAYSSMNRGEFFGNIYYIESFHDASILFIFVILISFYIGSDFLNRSISFQVSRGHSRKKIVYSKLIVSIVLSLIAVILYVFVGTIIVSLKKGYGSIISVKEIINMFIILCESMILNIGTVSCFVLIAFVCKDIVKSICLSILFIIICSTLIPNLKSIFLMKNLVEYFTITQISNIGIITLKQILVIVLSSFYTFMISYGCLNLIFKKMELK